MNFRKTFAAATLAAVTGAGCVDLEVQNPNNPDRDRALQTAGDVESLIAASYRDWYNAQITTSGLNSVLQTMSNQHSATAANFGMVEFSSWPRVAAQNGPTDAFVGQITNDWYRLYGAVAAVSVGLSTLNEGEVELEDPDDDARARAYGYFVLGLAHGSAAMLYDQAYIYDPSIPADEVTIHPWEDVLEAAFSYFDQAIVEATGADFEIPELWMGRTIDEQRLIRLSHSYKARYRVAAARTPEQRRAVDWTQVVADVEDGITEDFTWNHAQGTGWFHSLVANQARFGPWGQVSYQVLGMADVSGKYQEWISIEDPWQRHPNLPSGPFLIITPDLRFPQGSTIAEQQANDGDKFEIATASGGYSAQWARPDRGSFRWSYYRPVFWDDWRSPATNRGDWPEMTVREMRLLLAEAAYYDDDFGTVANIVNETRVPNGLSATDASGTNTSCVPKLPDGTCGDLWEMFKWEYRLETMFYGLHGSSWYFAGRGWGDLAQGSFLQVPIPAEEASLLGIEPYTFGGLEGEWSAPVGTYGY